MMGYNKPPNLTFRLRSLLSWAHSRAPVLDWIISDTFIRQKLEISQLVITDGDGDDLEN